MFETFKLFSAIAAAIFIEAMPFLVVGALFSAVIEVFVSTDRLLRHIPKSLTGGIILGVCAGFILPTCECGVVPIVRRLMNKGVPPFIAIAYMLAAPIVNPVVLASTYIAFRGSAIMVLARIAVAVVSAAVLGLYVRRLPDVMVDRQETKPEHVHDHSSETFIQKIRSVLAHGAQEFMDMGKFLILGAMAAAFFKTCLPENIMAFFTGSLAFSILGMMILAVLLSICSEADAFVASSFQMFPEGAKLAFIGIGPMVDLKLIGMYAVTFRRKVVIALILVPSIVIFVLSWLFEQMGIFNV
ncbi:MAG: permease [Planctomycetota bacterium]|jgi:uncharacterized membrane protein YraQ (UPF0718 family)